MFRAGFLSGPLADEIYDFFFNEIQNEAEPVWEGVLCDPNDENDPDRTLPIGIYEYA
jgi:hypothetical protein